MEANFSRRLLVRDENGDERQRLLMAPTLLSPRPRHGDVSLPLLRPLLRLFQGPPEYKVIGRSIAVHAMEELSRNKKMKVSRSRTVFSRGFRFQTFTSERKKKSGRMLRVRNPTTRALESVTTLVLSISLQEQVEATPSIYRRDTSCRVLESRATQSGSEPAHLKISAG